jgi:hypothetical protein
MGRPRDVEICRNVFGRVALAPEPVPEPILMTSPENSAHEKARKHWGKQRIEPLAPLSPILGDTHGAVVWERGI